MNKEKTALVILGSLVLAFQVSASATQPFGFEARVKAQEAIERVYYAHRVWPKENPTPKPPFEQMVPRAMLEAKVRDYLKKSAALEEYWQRPITAEQLQAEMERMARGTRDPAALKELFAALGNAPTLIAECLARPILADRLIRAWYANDERFHGDTKAKADAALASVAGGGLSLCRAGSHQKIVYILSASDGNAIGPRDQAARGETPLDAKHFEKELRESQEEGKPAVLRETPNAFMLIRTSLKTPARIEVETIAFSKRVLEDWMKTVEPKEHLETASSTASNFAFPVVTATPCGEGWYNGILDDVPEVRLRHSAIWTGTEMIIWGGIFPSDMPAEAGGRYNPSTDSWTGVSTGPNWPPGGEGVRCVWTGTEMIVWGGDDFYGAAINTGGRYNPSTDLWTPTSTGENCPSARDGHTAVWTGAEMVVWGGQGSGYLSTGGRYNPSSDTWVPTSTGATCPLARKGHVAVWTGTEMIVWGGSYWNDGAILTNAGGRYNPSSDTWAPTSTGSNCPSVRSLETAVWTGTEMIVWGGASDMTGGRYDPSADTWMPTSIGTNCPSARSGHTAVWTGTKMIIWGGGGDGSLNNGGLYNPVNDTWAPTSTGANCPSGRVSHTAVWTGTEMIVWGGFRSAYGTFNSGGRYNPISNSWVPTSQGPSCPLARVWHSAVWTGTEMIIWGGATDVYGNNQLNTGGRYNPATDSWAATSTGANCPSRRIECTAVWTGSEMVIWGGIYPYTNTGGRYNPVSDTWTATSIGANCPLGRLGHAAVWTGTEMIVWGGLNDTYGVLNNGGRYNPNTDTWAAVSTGVNCPVARSYPTPVWTGTEMIVWGGGDGNYYLNSGGRYNPSSDTWIPTSTGANVPSARANHTAVWTGTQMVVWGGFTGLILSDGGRYSPSTDTWAPTSTAAECPSARFGHTAVWTETEVIIWGGEGGYACNDGGRYDPTADMWVGIQDESGSPCARYHHKAVWTGKGMVIWGGITLSDTLNSGGQYFTACPASLSVSASAEPASGPAPLTVHFSGDATGGRAPYTYSWNFDDGSAASMDQNPDHAYSTAGTFIATLTVHDTAAGTATATVAITALGATQPGVSSMVKMGNPFRIIVNGSNLKNPVKVHINGGEQWTNVAWRSASKIVIKGGAALKAAVPKNTPTHFSFENPDGAFVKLDWQWP